MYLQLTEQVARQRERERQSAYTQPNSRRVALLGRRREAERLER